ncbi:hypothetical protein M406DRAFT_70243 [Cryphonectria parasitica EP155]|uniref:Uncharacterized protein n=1 Tax=Cryphonectria parasitica (strain ATCC 38755 / EP155) TaxID=660469 RepID=A0A9P4Y831_CRYP1|nr:uncharacterized protein M406DRAFT_70243 [Cryphonectria parasitica EP155]KAF3768149.1 hypothetical protein M406DRAFT_70243 [Cryphonectria parasitica EP155]
MAHRPQWCSKSLLRLISAITSLADSKWSALHALKNDMTPGENSSVASCMETYEHQRHMLERQLYQHSFHEKHTSETEEDEEERHISGVKRLAALMYFYARVDESGPYESHMGRLTEEILQLLPRVSLRTNTLLWPLFIVGTLGIRPESDDNRILVLRTLDALQRTRQLGCVRKARFVIEDVWKARDLSLTDAARGWSILDGKHGNISLA